MRQEQMEIGGLYNWKNQPERLVYLGCNWSGNGYWNQFALTDKPNEVWCETLDSDLSSFESSALELKSARAVQSKSAEAVKPKMSARHVKKSRKAEKRAAAQKGQTNDQ